MARGPCHRSLRPSLGGRPPGGGVGKGRAGLVCRCCQVVFVAAGSNEALQPTGAGGTACRCSRLFGRHRRLNASPVSRRGTAPRPEWCQDPAAGYRAVERNRRRPAVRRCEPHGPELVTWRIVWPGYGGEPAFLLQGMLGKHGPSRPRKPRSARKSSPTPPPPITLEVSNRPPRRYRRSNAPRGL